MFNNKFAFSIALAQLLVCSSPSVAADVAAPEKERVCAIAQDGMAEVKLGKLAETKSTSAEVKNFAKKMVEDHTKANTKLEAAAKESKLKLPKDVSAEHKKTYDQLAKLDGKDFEVKYMDEMVKGHAKALTAIGAEADQGTGKLKEWAEETIATIKTHDKLAKKVDTDVDKK